MAAFRGGHLLAATHKLLSKEPGPACCVKPDMQSPCRCCVASSWLTVSVEQALGHSGLLQSSLTSRPHMCFAAFPAMSAVGCSCWGLACWLCYLKSGSAAPCKRLRYILGGPLHGAAFQDNQLCLLSSGCLITMSIARRSSFAECITYTEQLTSFK